MGGYVRRYVLGGLFVYSVRLEETRAASYRIRAEKYRREGRARAAKGCILLNAST
jgi:hypothetical protein